jgi:glycosyltransferase involved in cell wall biosynthesis
MMSHSSPRLRIAFVNSIQMFAGGEVWMLTALAALRERGHQVLLICRPGIELERRARAAGFAVETIRFRGDFDPFTIVRLARIFRKHGVQVVLTNMDKELRLSGIAARLDGGPAVIPRRGIDYALKDRWRYRFAYNVLADRVIANSEATKRTLLSQAPWLSPERVEVVYNGIQLSNYDAHGDSRLRHELGLSEIAPIIGFVGQLDERKGIEDLLSAFRSVHRRLPEVHLVMAGTGPLEAMIQRFYCENQLGDVVHMLGFRDDVPAVMQAIDVLALPSRWEGFGLVLIEAMAASTPVVATRVSSIPEIVVDGKTGFLVPPGKPELLAERLVQVLSNRELAAEMGRHGRARVVERFTVDRMVNQMEGVFTQTLRQRQGRLT